MRELNKSLQDWKLEIGTIEKSQRKTTLEIENLGKRSGIIDASITNRIQETEEIISGAEDTTENIDTTVKDSTKSKNLLTQNIHEIQDTMKKLKLKITCVEESEYSQLKGLVNICNKIIEENFPNIKKEMPMNIQKAYRTKEFRPEKKFPLSHNNQNTKCTKQRKSTKSSEGKRSSSIKADLLELHQTSPQRL